MSNLIRWEPMRGMTTLREAAEVKPKMIAIKAK